MLSLYRSWLGPGPCVSRPAPPPGAHRPVPRRARAPTPTPPPAPSPTPSSTSSELDVERVEGPEPPKRAARPGAVLDVASCDGPVRFTRVPNAAWAEWCPPRPSGPQRPPVHYYPCKSCGCKFPSYYFVHKHRKTCHGDEAIATEPPQPEPSTSSAR